MIKVVYLIASHTNPQQVLRLVKTLRAGSPSAEIVVHHDYSCSYLDSTVFERLPHVYVIKDFIPVEWGDFSQVKMMLNAIEWITTHLKFDWLVLISGQDYPIQPLSQIERFLETTSYDGFITGVPLNKATPCGQVECSITNSAGNPCPDCVTRYYYRYYQASPNLTKMLKKVREYFCKRCALLQIRSLPGKTKTKIMIGVRSFLSPFNSEFECYKGSSWFTLNHRCLQYIRQFVLSSPGFVRYYQRTLMPDESFFQTILLNNPSLKILNDNKRLISWQDSTSMSPEVLRIQDFDRIIVSGQHFARKFDLNIDAEILDMIDHYTLKTPEVHSSRGGLIDKTNQSHTI